MLPTPLVPRRVPEEQVPPPHWLLGGLALHQHRAGGRDVTPCPARSDTQNRYETEAEATSCAQSRTSHVAQQDHRDQPHRWDASRQMLPFMQNVLPSGHAHTDVTRGPHPISGGPQVTSTYKLFSRDSAATTGLKRTRPLVKEGSKSGHWGTSTEGCRQPRGGGWTVCAGPGLRHPRPCKAVMGRMPAQL